MKYTRLGKTGLEVSRLCLGCMTYGPKTWREWMIEEKDARVFFQKALDLGINFFDTAEVYSNGESEAILGRALKDLVKNRESVVVATKVSPNGPQSAARGPNSVGLSRKHIMAACDASLKRLQTDYIDLYQIHRFDPFVTMEETAEALSDLVRAGKVRYIGASSMFAYQFADYLSLAEKHGWVKFVSMQNHYNMIYREEEREMMRLCGEKGIGVIPWSPLARGFLAGNRHRQGGGETARAKSDDFSKNLYYTDADFRVVDRNVEVANRLGVKPMQLAVAWVLANPVVTAPIIGASKLSHLDDAAGALDIELSAEDKRLLDEPYQPHRVLGHW